MPCRLQTGCAERADGVDDRILLLRALGFGRADLVVGAGIGGDHAGAGPFLRDRQRDRPVPRGRKRRRAKRRVHLRHRRGRGAIADLAKAVVAPRPQGTVLTQSQRMIAPSSQGLPIGGDAQFDNCSAGWLVYPPGTAHRPTVSQGRALVLYLLPEGRIDFTR